MKKIFVILCMLFVFLESVQANECEDQLFSLQSYQKNDKAVSVGDIVKQLSLECHITVHFEDEQSKKNLKTKLDFVNIKDYTFEQFLEFLFNEANLFYSYNRQKNLLSLNYLQTKTFSVDYIYLSESSSESSKSITTGASSLNNQTGTNGTATGGSSYATANTGGSGNGDNGTSSSNDYTLIKSKSEFTFWRNIQHNIERLLSFRESKNSIFINKDASLLTVTATKKEIQKISNYLDELMAKMHKQVLIEAKIIELTYDDSSSVGIDWSQLELSLQGSFGKTSGSPTTSTYSVAYNFSTPSFLKFLKTYGDVKVVSNPKILTMNNQPAVINVGEQLSYKFQTGSVTTTAGTAAGTNTYSIGSTFVGVTLFVIPEVSSDNKIIMKINPVVSKLSKEEDTNTAITLSRDLPPDTKVKQMTSIVKVNDGEKVVIGGLINITKGTTSKGIPILEDIPIFSPLFKYKLDMKTKTELFIVIQPKIVEGSRIPKIDEVELLSDKFFNDRNLTKSK
jgi:general secretion pathway protein D